MQSSCRVPPQAIQIASATLLPRRRNVGKGVAVLLRPLSNSNPTSRADTLDNAAQGHREQIRAGSAISSLLRGFQSQFGYCLMV